MGGCLIHTWDFFLWVDVGSILGTSFYGWMFDPYLGLLFMGGCLIILGTSFYGWMFDPYLGLLFMGGCLIILGTSFYGWMFDPYLGLLFMGGCLIHTWDFFLWVDV